MASAAYELFLEAMRDRRQVVCVFQGRRRELCPIILGHTGGKERVLAFQFAGESSRPLPPGGQWRCLTLSEVTDIELRDGPWRAGGDHGTQQSCVAEVDYDVNPDSPYSPRFRL
jgi:hypothetical protein